MNRSTLKISHFTRFGIYWICIIALFLPVYNAGFYSDFFGALNWYENQSFWDFINRTGNANQSLYHFTQLQLYFLISLFDAHPIPWFLLFTGMHALNIFLIYLLLKKWFYIIQFKDGTYIANIVAIVLLFIPSNVMVIVWKACWHYHTAVLYLLSILHLYLVYYQKQKVRYILFAGIIYLLSTFTLEWFYITPAILFLLISAIHISNKSNFTQYRKAIIHWILPLILIWIIHLITYNTVFDKWIAHYGFEPTEVFQYNTAATKLTKDYIHLLLFESNYKDAVRQEILKFAAMPVVHTLVVIIIGLLICWGILRFRKWNPILQVNYTLFLMALCSHILILPFWYNNYYFIGLDLYYYIPGIFYYSAITVFIFNLFKNRKVINVIIGIFVLVCIGISIRYILIYKTQRHIQSSLIDDFRKHHIADTVVFLGMPQNYLGIPVMQYNNPKNINQYMQIFGWEKVPVNTYNVSAYNIFDENEGQIAVVKDSVTIQLRPNSFGRWIWRAEKEYENELYAYQTDDHFIYTIKLKKTASKNTKFLIHKGLKWKELDFTKIGIDQ